MTKIAITPNAAGSGTFTIAAPNSNTNRTFTLPDAAGEVLTDASNLAAGKLTGDVAAARITDALNAGGSAPIFACRAWVNFNGTTSPGTIRASGNVSSVTRNATGDYTVNFATAMPDADFATMGYGQRVTSAFSNFTSSLHESQPGTGGVRIYTANASNGAAENAPVVCVSIFR
jgi:hypothetical protein